MAFEFLTGELPTDKELRRHGWVSSSDVLRTINEAFEDQQAFDRRCLEGCHRWLRVSPHARDLVAQLLRVDPEERISAAGALKHPWLRDDVPLSYAPGSPGSGSPPLIGLVSGARSNSAAASGNGRAEDELEVTLIARVQRFRTQMAVKQIVLFLLAIRIVGALGDEETIRCATLSHAVSSNSILDASDSFDFSLRIDSETEADSPASDTNAEPPAPPTRSLSSRAASISRSQAGPQPQLQRSAGRGGTPLYARIQRSAPIVSAYADVHRLFFKVLDQDKTGVVSFSEFSRAMKGMKYFLYDDEAQMLLKAADLDDSGYISFVEFVAVAMDWGAVKSAPGGVWECMLLDCFEELDLDGSGRISARELRAALDRNYAHVAKTYASGESSLQRRAALEVDLAIKGALGVGPHEEGGDEAGLHDPPHLDFEGFLAMLEPELELDTFSDRLPTRHGRRAMRAYVGKQVRRHDMVPGCGRGLGGLLACFWPCCVTRRETITPPPQADNADAQAR